MSIALRTKNHLKYKYSAPENSLFLTRSQMTANLTRVNAETIDLTSVNAETINLTSVNAETINLTSVNAENHRIPSSIQSKPWGGSFLP